MLAPIVLAFFCALTGVAAHGYVGSWVIDGAEEPGFNPADPMSLGSTAQRPTDNKDFGPTDFTTTSVACGGQYPGANLQTWPLKAGRNITANWEWYSDSAFGPVVNYMAPCPKDNCDGVEAAGLPWFKISQRAWYKEQWPTIIRQKGGWTFKIPASLKPGAYLVRHELIDLSNVGKPEVHPVCIQIRVESSGTKVPRSSDLTTFPAAYIGDDDWVSFNDWADDRAAFRPPGPVVATLVSE